MDALRLTVGAATEGKRWFPNPGPQTEAYLSQADELFYGGAAGGGKTDLLVGLALNEHTKSLIVRREGPDLDAMEGRFKEIIGSTEGWNGQDRKWRFDNGHEIKLGSCKNEDDKQGYQGQAHDLKAFDEITQFTETQYRYISGWNRSTKTGQRCRIIATGNPPMTAVGAWVKQYWGPWLDRTFPNKAKSGELRWATTDPKTGKTMWVDKDWRGLDEVTGEEIRPRSRTFIPALLKDNPYLGSDYLATVANLPEPLRTQLLRGDFNAAERDQVNQVIPTAWVRAAQQRWKSEGSLRPMVSMGADVAQGGADDFALAPRHQGDHIAELHTLPGIAVEDGPKSSAWVLERQRNGAQINIDMGGGYGSDLRTHLKSAKMSVWEYNGANSATRDGKNGLKFANMRAQIHWNMRELLDPAGERRVALPPDEKMVADLCSATWTLTPRGILIEEKDSIRKKLGRSPDRGEAVMIAFAEPRDDTEWAVRGNRPPHQSTTAETRDPLWE